MQDKKLVLVKVITLLFRESSLAEKSGNSIDLVRTILDEIKPSEVNLSINQDKDLVTHLKETAIYLCGLDKVDKNDLLQRLKVNCNYDDKLFEAFKEGIDKDMDDGSLKRTILSMRKFLNDYFRENEITKIIKIIYNDIIYNRDKIKNLKTYLGESIIRLEPYTIEATRKDPAIIGTIDLCDTNSLNLAIEEIKNQMDSTGIMKTGWQGLNRMLQGGFRRGEQWVTPALQHKWKTGHTLTLFKQLAIYNTPYLLNKNKKPLIIRFSFEDNLSTNVQFLYQNMYFNEHGDLDDISKISSSYMAGYIKDKLNANGFHIKMERIDPTTWNYRDFQNRLLELEADGYEIVACIADYLGLIPTRGCEDGPSGHALRDLFRRMRAFTSSRGIIFITPHQLSTDAKQLIRDGKPDFVKNLPGNGYFSGSKQLDQEVDGIYYLHIEKMNKRAYLTIQHDKHRGLDVLNEDDRYFVLPFPEKGPIIDDLNRSEITLRKVGGGPIGSAEETPFFAFNQ